MNKRTPSIQNNVVINITINIILCRPYHKIDRLYHKEYLTDILFFTYKGHIKNFISVEKNNSDRKKIEV